MEINHIARVHDGKIICKCSCDEGFKDERSIKRTYKRTITSVTSYEIVLLLIRLRLVSILSWNPIQLIRWNLQLGLI